MACNHLHCSLPSSNSVHAEGPQELLAENELCMRQDVAALQAGAAGIGLSPDADFGVHRLVAVPNSPEAHHAEPIYPSAVVNGACLPLLPPCSPWACLHSHWHLHFALLQYLDIGTHTCCMGLSKNAYVLHGLVQERPSVAQVWASVQASCFNHALLSW